MSSFYVLRWSGRAMVRLTFTFIWIIVGQGPTVLVVCAGGGCGQFFTRILYLFSFCVHLGDGSIYMLTEILSLRAVKPKTNKQPTNRLVFQASPALGRKTRFHVLHTKRNNKSS